ncbi:MAG: hypothetical protein COA45_06165 [Zetaproteobacteria bacterium]|nr:MAG: hypothetical protein COA45_06165 [Zetaproteobacteria bacterium]
MIESDNNFEEYEFDDDLDNSWDGEILDEVNIDENTKREDHGPSHKKRKSIVKPIIFLALLGGIFFVAYPFFIPSQEKTQIPIIKIDKYSNTKHIQQNDARTTTQTQSTQNQAQRDNEIPAPFKNIPIKQSHKTILTPLPNDSLNNTIALPDLTFSPQSNTQINDLGQNKLIGHTSKTLSEDELLSKTDTVFEEIIEPSPTILPPKMEAPLPLSHKEEKIKEIIIESSETPPLLQKEIIKNTAEKNKDTNTTSKKTPKNIKKMPQKAAWTIRAAQPGKAVIYDKNNKEMKSVEVNDTLIDIGRIKSIQLKNGRWIITGTKGKIVQ